MDLVEQKPSLLQPQATQSTSMTRGWKVLFVLALLLSVSALLIASYFIIRKVTPPSHQGSIFLSPSYMALFLALTAVLSAPLANRIARKRWKRTDGFRGIQITLSTFFAALAYVFDLAEPSNAPQAAYPSIPSSALSRLQITLLFLMLCFGTLLSIIPAHQSLEETDTKPVSQAFILGLGTNIVGIILVGVFVLLIKGG